MEDKEKKFDAFINDVAGMIASLIIINSIEQRPTTLQEVLEQDAMAHMVNMWGMDATMRVINTAVNVINKKDKLTDEITLVLKDGTFMMIRNENVKLEPSTHGAN